MKIRLFRPWARDPQTRDPAQAGQFELWLTQDRQRFMAAVPKTVQRICVSDLQMLSTVGGEKQIGRPGPRGIS